MSITRAASIMSIRRSFAPLSSHISGAASIMSHHPSGQHHEDQPELCYPIRPLYHGSSEHHEHHPASIMSISRSFATPLGPYITGAASIMSITRAASIMSQDILQIKIPS